MLATMTEELSPPLSPGRKRLLYRAMHRGFKEADIVVGQFAAQNLAGFDEAEEAEFARLLDVPDQDLFAWIIKRAPTPPNYEGPVLTRMQAFDVAAVTAPPKGAV